MKTGVDYYWIGYRDGNANDPRAKGLKGHNKTCYENGYREGQTARTQEATQRKQTSKR